MESMGHLGLHHYMVLVYISVDQILGQICELEDVLEMPIIMVQIEIMQVRLIRLVEHIRDMGNILLNLLTTMGMLILISEMRMVI